MIKLILIVSLWAIASGNPAGKVIPSSNYSKLHLPLVNRSDVLNITVGLVITQILDIDFTDSSLDFNIEFISTWKDELIDIQEGLDGKVQLENPSEIWTPDLYIYNSKKFKMMNMGNSMSILTLQKNGSVVDVCYTFEAEVVITCDAKFSDFPFHKHQCLLELGSFSKNSKQLQFLPNTLYDSETLSKLKSFDYEIMKNLKDKRSTNKKDKLSNCSITHINIPTDQKSPSAWLYSYGAQLFNVKPIPH